MGAEVLEVLQMSEVSVVLEEQVVAEVVLEEQVAAAECH